MRILLIGCGYWGSKLAERFAKLGCTLHLYDLDPEKSQALRRSLNGKPDVWYPPLLDAVLHGEDDEHVDACVIATPIKTHYELALKCLTAGKHVLVEKPLATSHEAARELYLEAVKHGKVLMVDSTFLYHPALGRVRRDIRSLSAVWCNAKDRLPEDSVWWTLGPHPVSIMLAMMGHPLGVNNATMRHTFARVDFSYSAGRTARIEVSWENPLRVRGLEVLHSNFVAEYVGLDDRVKPEPLVKMCETFLGRIHGRIPRYDDWAVDTVALLSRAESTAAKELAHASPIAKPQS